ncbi:MAG: hypothetical protein IT446_03315 [Phycisphaerales bacterium]|nr:hypothetical protein [Phycisphaerales bacterium]
MSFTVAPIVEGHGDVPAIRVLLNRMNPSFHVATPVRYPRSKLILPEHLSRAAQIAATNIRCKGGLLLMLDADEDCAKTLGPKLQDRLEKCLPNVLCRVVLPVREFEAWIVGGNNRYVTIDPDSTGDLKGKIKSIHGHYKETVDQPKLIAAADLELLRQRSRSFRHLQKIVNEFTEAAR